MAATLPDSSIKSTSVGDVTPQDIAEYRQDRSGPHVDGLGLDMSGQQFQHMESSRWDLEPRGITSQQPALQPPEIPQDAIASVNQPALLEPPAAPQPEVNYQQKYGESENEKGAWRALAQQYAEYSAALQEQLSQINNRLNATPSAPAAPAQPQPLFQDKNPNELLTVADMEGFLNRVLLPAMESIPYRSADLAAAKAQRLLPNWDVSVAEERQALNELRQKYSGFDQRFTASEQNSMISDQVAIVRSRRPVAMNAAGAVRPQVTPVGPVGAGAPPTTVRVVDPASVVRRQTYVESAAPAQVSAEPTNPLNLNDRIRQAWTALDAKWMAEKGRKAPATEIEKLLISFGAQKVNDWGGGQVLSR